MAYTEFYQQLETDSAKITWKDVFSEYKKKHTKADLEYALLAGTSLDSATEENMLRKWKKPWVFYPLAKSGLALVAMIYGLLYISIVFFQGVTFLEMVNIIPPLIIPMIVMVFIWELNIPRNISIYDLLKYFLVGGLLSFFVLIIMFEFINGGDASWAAFREEPAKLAASLALLHFFSKKKKVYGLTGLVIGAAVGAGFGGFESVAYAVSAGENGILVVVFNEIIRGIFALGGHTVYCAPYVAAIALEMKDSRLTWHHFLSRDFLITFTCSTAAHFIWNSNLFHEFFVMKHIVIIILLWVELLYIARKCLQQAVVIGRRRQESSGGDLTRPLDYAGSIQIICISGPAKGVCRQFFGNEPITIGRNADMDFCITGPVRGVSRQHCSIQKTPRGWVIRDMNSTYGTFTNRKQKLMPGIDYVLQSDEIIYLAGKENAFQITID